MPKETLRRLEEDTGRLLVAGAHLASADPELAKDRASLEKLAAQLGDRAPVLGQLAQAVAKVVGAGSKDAARELVSLATSVAQVRAAQAALAPAAGDARALPSISGALGTPCNARDLYDLEEALVTSGAGRMEKVDAGIERGDIADLRLVDALVQAMGDSYLGEKITREVVPLLGRAISGPIRRRFNPKGTSHDARRLRALATVEKADAKDVIVQSLREGKPEIREVAFDALADHVAGLPELESVVLEVIAKERAQGVKRAATRALAGYGSDAALEALLPALDQASTRDAAAEALGRSTHPKVVDRLFALLDSEPAEPKKPKKSAAKAGAPAPDAKELAKAKKEDERERMRAILRALAPHKDARIAARALELVESHGGPAAAAVVGSGDRAALAKIADLLAEKDDELYAPAVAAAVKLGPDEAWKRLTSVFKAKDRTHKTGVARIEAALAAIGPGADKRWVKLLLDEAGEDAFAPSVCRALGNIGDRSAVKPLVARLAKAKGWEIRAAITDALGALKDPQAIDAILDVAAQEGDYRVGYAARRAILAINDVSAVQKVRDVIEKKTQGRADMWRLWSLRELLSNLVERFPGQ